MKKQNWITYIENRIDNDKNRLVEVNEAINSRRVALNHGDCWRIEDDAYACYKEHLERKLRDSDRELRDIHAGEYDDCLEGGL